MSDYSNLFGRFRGFYSSILTYLSFNSFHKEGDYFLVREDMFYYDGYKLVKI